MVELSFELKVRLGLEDDLLQGLLQRQDTSLGVLTELSDSLVLVLTVKALLLRLVHLHRKQEEGCFDTFLGGYFSKSKESSFRFCSLTV